MRDEDDDLLRAAEELGIDLSGVRAPAPEAAGEEAAAEGEAASTNGAAPDVVEALDGVAEVSVEDDAPAVEETIDVEELLDEVADLEEIEDDLPETAPLEGLTEETET
jgi:DNA-directed RNA polymerase subunit beta